MTSAPSVAPGPGRLVHALAALLAAVALAGCGQKGPLELPPPAAEAGADKPGARR